MQGRLGEFSIRESRVRRAHHRGHGGAPEVFWGFVLLGLAWDLGRAWSQIYSGRFLSKG